MGRRRSLLLATATVLVLLLLAWALPWPQHESAAPVGIAPRPVTGTTTLPDLSAVPAAADTDKEPIELATTLPPEDEDTSIEEEYRRLVARLEELPEEDLDDLVGHLGLQTSAAPVAAELRNLSQRFIDEQWALVEQRVDPEIVAEMRATLKNSRHGTPEFLDEIARISALMAARGDDLLRATCRALASEEREKVLAVLLGVAPLSRDSLPLVETYMQILRRLVARRETLLVHYLFPRLLLSIRFQERDPYPIWRIAMDSEMPELIRQVLLDLFRFPAAQIEPLLILGLRDPRWDVRFGALETARWYGTEGELSDPLAMAREIQAAARVYPDQPGRSVLLLEVIAAIGQADPVLLELVNPSTSAELRELAATNFVLGVDEDTARHWIGVWLADSALFETAILALGVLPGEMADELLRSLARQGGDATATVLATMSGRGPQFISEFLAAMASDDDAVRRAALNGLFNLVGDERLDAAAQAQLIDGLASAAARDPMPEQRQQALLGLAFQGSPDAVAGLREQFLSERDDEVRGLAGSLLLLSSADDPDQRAWVERRIEEESFAVRLALREFQDSLKDPSRRQQLLASLTKDSETWLVVDRLVDSTGAAKNPIGQHAQRLRAIQAAFDAWAAQDAPTATAGND